MGLRKGLFIPQHMHCHCFLWKTLLERIKCSTHGTDEDWDAECNRDSLKLVLGK